MSTPFNQPRYGYGATTIDRATIDEALRAYMLRVYNYMGSGLALSAIVALLVAQSPALMQTLFGSGLAFVVMLAPLGILLAMSFGANRMSAGTVQVLYWAFTATMGLSISTIFLVYTGESILRIFFITAAMFGAMSLWGYTTKRDLTGMGAFLFMGVIGLIIASVVNIFLGSTVLQMAVSAITVLVFTGLTAYDTQRIKSEFYEGTPSDVLTKQAVFGAVALYVNFLNIFMALLSLFGQRND
ncbi:MAG TPA: Bax inhibitor-1/YccA family protein [Ferrovibrio sp.]|jgi:FtsH-binding integral membrane protein|uniref:Bax inhibitor-1/YccA family protein n=1 Tax=Ferrovibrio sp. TaxID=1917215 RepID=UPI002B4B49DB|nr:Bax inhibitor-1/YccA family protein [Ferrovibrio sp.]HLT77043.1 Bax inhibitor-1/YccA family protein [Ferrovibrio sp.]